MKVSFDTFYCHFTLIWFWLFQPDKILASLQMNHKSHVPPCCQNWFLTCQLSNAAFCSMKLNTCIISYCRVARFLKTARIRSKPEHNFDCLQINRLHTVYVETRISSCSAVLSLANGLCALTYKCIALRRPICWKYWVYWIYQLSVPRQFQVKWH